MGVLLALLTTSSLALSDAVVTSPLVIKGMTLTEDLQKSPSGYVAFGLEDGITIYAESADGKCTGTIEMRDDGSISHSGNMSKGDVIKTIRTEWNKGYKAQGAW